MTADVADLASPFVGANVQGRTRRSQILAHVQLGHGQENPQRTNTQLPQIFFIEVFTDDEYHQERQQIGPQPVKADKHWSPADSGLKYEQSQ